MRYEESAEEAGKEQKVLSAGQLWSAGEQPVLAGASDVGLPLVETVESKEKCYQAD